MGRGPLLDFWSPLVAGSNGAKFHLCPGCPLTGQPLVGGTGVVMPQAVAAGLEGSRKGGCGPHAEGGMFPWEKCWRLRDDGMGRTQKLASLSLIFCLLT